MKDNFQKVDKQIPSLQKNVAVGSPTNNIAPTADFGYGQMLAIKAPFNLSDAELDSLAEFMTSRPAVAASKIPAGYTYLSQFIDHDISSSSRSTSGSMWTTINPADIRNQRTPFFDLETIYGSDAPSNQGEIARADLLATPSLLKLGETGKSLDLPPFPNDLPRNPGNPPRARIVDARNDENLAIAQTQVAFIKFHNAVANELGGADTPARFEEARRLVIRHYQHIVLHDFLKRIVKESVWNEVVGSGNVNFYKPDLKKPFIPLEFSTAAFRAGHSMVNSFYEWNRVFNNNPNRIHASLDMLIKFTGSSDILGFDAMAKLERLPSDWIINWYRFYDIDDSINGQGNNFNFAAKIDPAIAPQLGRMNAGLEKYKRECSLAALDLYRTRALGLPSGQIIAGLMSSGSAATPLDANKISALLPANLQEVFANETPLWFYLLAEAAINEDGERLGEAGSRIVAETIFELIRASEFSIVEDNLTAGEQIFGTSGTFRVPEMLKFIQSKNTGWDELNPVG